MADNLYITQFKNITTDAFISFSLNSVLISSNVAARNLEIFYVGPHPPIPRPLSPRPLSPRQGLCPWILLEETLLTSLHYFIHDVFCVVYYSILCFPNATCIVSFLQNLEIFAELLQGKFALLLFSEFSIVVPIS